MVDLLKELEAVVRAVGVPKYSEAHYEQQKWKALKFIVDHYDEIAEALKAKTCAWTQDEWDGSWDTACGNKHQFTDGSPRDNDHAFCPYCGGKLEVVYTTIDAIHNSAREVRE